MLHESPLGMGIAHDYDNVYWYNDGFYNELVRYDFQQDHDTGEHDHLDGIVHRYSEIDAKSICWCTWAYDSYKDTGILYISDTGATEFCGSILMTLPQLQWIFVMTRLE